MAHFAKVESGTVTQVIVAEQDYINTFPDKDKWIQTSYNTRGGKHYKEDNTLSDDQSKAFRKNYAGIGFTWDEDRDAFYPPKPYASWVLNETTCLWDAPVARPSVETYGSGENTKNYDIAWDETNTRWVATYQEDPVGNFRWDASASTWVAL